jgi:hypothetical protein
MILKNPNIEPKTIRVVFGIYIILTHPSAIMIDFIIKKRNMISWSVHLGVSQKHKQT